MITIEIEPDDPELIKMIRQDVRRAIASYSLSYQRGEELKQLIKKAWNEEATKAVNEAVQDLPALTEMARESVKKKVESQLRKLMK